MPTYARTARFRREFRRLDPARQRAFLAMVERFVNSLARGQFDPTLRVKRVQGTRDVWEISWAPDGRATFSYGPEVRTGQAHVIWRRVGTHRVLEDP
ncbi:MAG: hypothetical protein M3515_11355 [Actinomycetota bacterium]|jgi:hypothetical protein|nr:hypothetical protein [Actinomycetota bacterium]MDQ3357157.1 hypothetical protein [Actinomycetota bacterium]